MPFPTADRPGAAPERRTRVVVTGAAGFIGARLSHRLLDDGFEVVGIDGFTDTYDPAEKLGRAAELVTRDGFTLTSGHLADIQLDDHLEGAEVVFHLAGRAGVRASFTLESRYRHDNVTSTERLLDACRRSGSVRRLVYASSSSVYGDAALPFREEGPTSPVSPYGLSKLEAERLCLAASGDRLETVALRYFTVYGPGQRPDMGLRIFAETALDDRPISVFGDGSQSRDFTYVDDIVTATCRAATAPVAGMAVNVGGGSRVTLCEVLDYLSELLDRPLRIRLCDFARGDVLHTEADLSRAADLLGFEAATPFHEGYRSEVEWLRGLRQCDVRRTA